MMEGKPDSELVYYSCKMKSFGCHRLKQVCTQSHVSLRSYQIRIIYCFVCKIQMQRKYEGKRQY